ncbi:hypothetical protein JCM3775_000275 [Rhodotorula graminis]
MQPSYKFPRSLGSLDLTDPSSVPAPPPAGGPSGSRSHPSLLVTDSSGHPQASLSDEQYLDKFTTAVNTLREGGSSAGLAAPNPAHLSTQSFGRSKSLSRISEYSESAYSSGSRARDSHEPPPSPPPRSDASRSPSPGGASPIDPAFGSAPSSFSFPAPPAIYAAHLAPQGAHPQAQPPLVPVTTPVSPKPVPSQRFHVTNPDAMSPSLSPSPIPGRHHLPSRPLTTPLPLANPHPVPVPLDNFAAPPAAPPRADSPQWSSSSHSHEYGSSSSPEYMVQLPSRAVLAEHAQQQQQQQQQQRFSRHGQEHSESSTAWATAEDEKFFNEAGGNVYAAPYHAMSFEAHGDPQQRGGDSPNRFTLDDEKIGVGRDLQQRRKGSDATTMTATQGWEPEGEQVRRGANRRLWWALLVVVIIAVAVGVGVGVGRKQADAGRAENDSLASSSASPSSSPSSPSPSSASTSSSSRTVIRPSATSAASTASTNAAAAAAVETYSTTFGYEQSGRSTVVPLTYTIPTSYATRADGRYQFTQQVVLPNLGATGARAAESFTSDLRFRVAPTDSAAPGGGATIEARRERERRRSVEERVESARRWDRRERDKRARVIR